MSSLACPSPFESRCGESEARMALDQTRPTRSTHQVCAPSLFNFWIVCIRSGRTVPFASIKLVCRVALLFVCQAWFFFGARAP